MPPRKHKLHPLRQRALDNVWRHGLSDVQKKIVNALDARFSETEAEPSLEEIAAATGLSYGAVWTAIGVLEHFGYVVICRDHKGRALRRGVMFMYGFNLSAEDDDAVQA
jgi:biotin operon repressor